MFHYQDDTLLMMTPRRDSLSRTNHIGLPGLLAAVILAASAAVFSSEAPAPAVEALHHHQAGHSNTPLEAISGTAAADPSTAGIDPADPHAHHRKMLQRTDLRRSEHCYELPDLSLVNADGEQVSLQAVLDAPQPVMLNFIFTTCTTICPVQSAAFRQVQQQLGAERDQVRMISITIDPEHDTPRRLQAYAERFEAGPQWQFLTGNLADIVVVQKAFNAYRGNKMSHEPLTLLRASPDASWVRLDGMASASDIVREYRQLVTNQARIP